MSRMTNVPYRAQAPGAGFAPIGKNTRFVFGAIVGLMLLLFVTSIGTWTAAIIASQHNERHQPNETLMTVGAIALVVMLVMLYGQIAAGLVWVYKAWSWVPWDQRYTRHWRSWLTPSQVALMLLIPYFHYYWMFVANVGLCDALDRMRVSYPTSRPAPKGLAIAACVCQLVIPFPVGSILWLVFMSRIERMTAEMSASMAPRLNAAF
jgi:hypothetical protein